MEDIAEDIWNDLATEFVNEISMRPELDADVTPLVPQWYLNFIRSYDDLPSIEEIEQYEQ